MNRPPRCPHGPGPTLLQAAVALADALIADGLSMQVLSLPPFGECSGSAVAAVIDSYACFPALELGRPDVIDPWEARQQTECEGIDTGWLVHHMQHLIVASTRSEPVIL